MATMLLQIQPAHRPQHVRLQPFDAIPRYLRESRRNVDLLETDQPRQPPPAQKHAYVRARLTERNAMKSYSSIFSVSKIDEAGEPEIPHDSGRVSHRKFFASNSRSGKGHFRLDGK